MSMTHLISVVMVLGLARGCETIPKEVLAATPPPVAATATAANEKPLNATPPNDTSVHANMMPSFGDLVAKVKGAVVNVEVRGKAHAVEGQNPFGGEDSPFGGQNPFQQFQRNRRGQEQIQRGLGSGFIVDPKGLVVTNNHVVENATTIKVTLEDGRSFDGKVVGRDPLTDVALVQLSDNPTDLPYLAIGDSDAVRVGDWLVAIGNPYGLSSSVSAGILSARARDIREGPYDDFLQTDAAINPGNSGGPLFNLKGEVIGMNTAIIGGSGIGFAVPSNMIKSELPGLQKGAIARGWLGVGIQDLDGTLAKALKVPVAKGAVVADVNKNGPAEKGGLKANDVVVTIDGTAITSGKGLSRLIGTKSPDSVVAMTVYRNGNKVELKVKLGLRPDIEKIASRGGGEEDQQSEDLDQPQQRGNAKTARLGITVEDGERQGAGPGALVAAVEPDSIGEKADLRPGMLIVAVGDQTIHSSKEFVSLVRQAKPGTTLLLKAQVGQGHVLRALTIS